MDTPLTTSNSTVISAFNTALLRQGLVVLAILALIAIGWNILRTAQLRQAIRAHAAGESVVVDDDGTTTNNAEPIARKVLRLGFGFLWLFDGLLQIQSSMPLGLPQGALAPAGATSPTWIQHIVNFGVTLWSNHPVPAAASVVWIQAGIGIFMLVAPRGRWSRVAGLSSLGWGLIVWVFGEAFGGIFAPGVTFLFGAPGAAVLYAIAGALVALPESSWSRVRLGKILLWSTGTFFIGMAVLQAWPGRGFWQGHAAHGGATGGTLLSMVSDMAGTTQPPVFSSAVTHFSSLDASHGFAVNLIAVIGLFVVGFGCVFARRRLLFATIVFGIIFCAADWIFIEDIGIFGGIGTDPNSMIPIGLFLVSGYLALTRSTATADATEVTVLYAAENLPWRERLIARPVYALRMLAAAGSVGIVLLGALPMAFASTNSSADPILNEAIDGAPNVTNTPAPTFSLVNQFNRPVSLTSLQGKTVALTFLDPVCTTDCPLIAQDFRNADLSLNTAQRANAVFVAVDVNPIYLSTSALQAFDKQEGLSSLTNWLFLTGTKKVLQPVWDDYGVSAVVEPGGAMVDHSDITYVIDAKGNSRFVLDEDPGDGTAPLQSSAAGVLADTVVKTEAFK